MEQGGDKLIQSILERLNRMEAEIEQIKAALPASGESAHTATASRPADSVQGKTVIPPDSRARPVPAKRPLKTAGSGDSLENAIGTRWIGRIGMLAIIFGIAFFLKYSFDNRLIGETGRIILGIFWGICFIGAGEYFQKKKNWHIYGQILTGGGLAVLYFSIYAAFAFYHLISIMPAFAVLVVVTTTGITLSVRYSAISIVVIGILGGFLTPIMLSTGENRPMALFSYVLLLDAGIMSVVYFKRWHSVGIVSLLCTIIMYAAWHGKFYTLDQQSLAFAVVGVFFVFYNMYVLFSSSGRGASFAEQAIILISAAFYFLSFDAQNQSVNNWNLKSFTLSLAFIEILFAGLSLKFSPNGKAVIYTFAGMSALLNVVAIFIVFEKTWITAALAAEVVIFAYIGARLKKFPVRALAYILGLLSIIRFFGEIDIVLGPFDKFTLFMNNRFLVCGFVIASFYILLALLNKNKTLLGKNESAAIPVTLALTQVLSVILLSMEFYDFYRLRSPHEYLGFAEFRYARQLSLSIVWALYASVMVVVGMMKKIRLLRIMGIALIGLTIIKVFFLDLAELKTIYRIVSFVILGVLLLTISYLYNRFKHRIFGES